jgi:hypothetical protein
VLSVITSDYHLNRVKIIFNEILNDYDIGFIGVRSNLEQEEYDLLMLHEKKSINIIVQNGLYY